MIFDYSKLKDKIETTYITDSTGKQHRYTRKQFAKDIGLTYSGLYKKLRGWNCFDQIEIKKSQQVLNISDDEIVDYFFRLKVSK